MHDLDSWARHPQGSLVAGQPLVELQEFPAMDAPRRRIDPERPLAGIKVLDLTRVLAGPVAGRFLAAYGAEVLRLDPPHWDEEALEPEVTLGKRCAGLDLKQPDGRARFEKLLAEADILLHGYRADALANLGYDAAGLRKIRPGLIDVSLNAFGWKGPWQNRRGFDSLVQMSSGIADFGMRMSGNAKPTPLPVQALDMATGYLIAAAAAYALAQQGEQGAVLSARLSLARTAALLIPSRRDVPEDALAPETEADHDPRVEYTAWGPAQRVRFPVTIRGARSGWRYPAGPLRTAGPYWA
jgi:crotonobetainyl-CoA:carnitine CoA-transferase CaiB-like acyl-CoA transferase